ncbi:MAG: LPS assembly lipoprotein LptE [Desulfovibrionaceae bacterium]
MWWWRGSFGSPSPRRRLPSLVRCAAHVALLLALFAPGCAGYKVGPPPAALPPGIHSLAVRAVTNPSLEYSLGQRLRSLIRDEFHHRGMTEWAARDQADGLMTIAITRFSMPGSVTDESDATVKYAAILVVEATITKRDGNVPVWESGPLMIRRSFYGGEREEAQELVAQLAAREIADRLAHAY